MTPAVLVVPDWRRHGHEASHGTGAGRDDHDSIGSRAAASPCVGDLVRQEPACATLSTPFIVRVEATIRRVSASTQTCNLLHGRRSLFLCFLVGHASPGPHNRRPVLSTSRCTGRVPGQARGTFGVSARRLERHAAGCCRSGPARPAPHATECPPVGRTRYQPAPPGRARGRPPLGFGRSCGNSTSTTGQRSSGTRRATPPQRLSAGFSQALRQHRTGCTRPAAGIPRGERHRARGAAHPGFRKRTVHRHRHGRTHEPPSRFCGRLHQRAFTPSGGPTGSRRHPSGAAWRAPRRGAGG